MFDNPVFKQIALNVMSDPSFARRLLEQPTEALQSINVEPTPELLQILTTVDKEAMLSMADTFTDEHKAM